jgi:hypothetical protein
VFEWGDEGGPYKGFERCSLDDPWVIMMARFVIQQFNNLNVGLIHSFIQTNLKIIN